MKKISLPPEKIFANVTVQKRPEIIKALKKNGVLLKNPNNNSELLTAMFTAFSKSPQFKKDFTVIAKDAEYSNYIDEDFFNADDATTPKTGYQKFKDTAATYLSKDRINSLIDTGINYLNTKLTASANKGAEERAIQFEVQKAQTALAEAQAAEQKRLASQTKNKWVVPLVIGGVVIAGVIAYFVFKKGKKQ